MLMSAPRQPAALRPGARLVSPTPEGAAAVLLEWMHADARGRWTTMTLVGALIAHHREGLPAHVDPVTAEGWGPVCMRALGVLMRDRLVYPSAAGGIQRWVLDRG